MSHADWAVLTGWLIFLVSYGLWHRQRVPIP